MQNLREVLQQQLDRLQANQYDTRPLVFDPPASSSEVAALEADLGFPLPPSFRNALMKISSHVEFRWFAPKDMDFPEPFDSNFCGDLHWSLKFTRQFNSEKDGWIKTVFPNRNDPYDAVWHNKLAFLEVGNGDYLSLDLATPTFGQVVYLSHDDGEGHGHVLAEDFERLLHRWVPLGCTGGEDWQWLPFFNSGANFIDSSCPNAEVWRKIIGINECSQLA